MREPILSVTRKDLELQTFRAGGKGGQHQNKANTGVRIIHRDSGAVGEARDSRSQFRNRKAALKRLSESVKFRVWLNKQLYGESQKEKIEAIVEKSLVSENLKVEVKDVDNNWVEGI